MAFAFPQAIARHGVGCACCEREPALPASGGRTRLWELPESLHCSVIGTCLTTAELRRALGRLDLAPVESSDHDLHARAVALCGRESQAARLLGKTLDQRHRTEISRFGKADTEAAVGALWQDAVGRAEIPGAYWAVLTHPASSGVLIQRAFGEVHMLSHLLGAANRADLRRLRMLEQENAELREAQDALRLQHQATIARLQAELSGLRRDVAAPCAPATPAEDVLAQRPVWERRLALQTHRLETSERELQAACAERDAERQARQQADARFAAASEEIAALEMRLNAETTVSAAPARLEGLSLLYVGGRAGQIAHLRGLAERAGAALLHHDGGMEDSADLLPGLVARADLVLFPVDCVSHDAALRVKRLCRQADKRFVPLRSTGTASFLSGIARAA